MEDNVLTVEELDRLLAEEFLAEPVEKLTEATTEEPEEDETDEIEEEVDEDTDEAEDEEDEKEVEEPQEKPNKRTPDEKKEYAFAKLRKEATEAKKFAEEAERKSRDYDTVLKSLMKEAGYSDFEEFKRDVEAQVSERERTKLGYTPEEYGKIKSLEQREKELNEKEEKIRQQDFASKAKRFDETVRSYSEKYGLGEKGVAGVYKELQDSGYTPEMLLSMPNPELLIKGTMADFISQNPSAQSTNKKSVDTKKLHTKITDTGSDDLEKLLKKELREYELRKFGR